MESTKSQLVLRSMDMDGRSLGTERSSTFPDGTSNNQPSARVSDALAGGDRFAALLANRTEHGPGQSAQENVSARIREGRTDAASATYNARENRDKAWTPRGERSVERRDSSESWETAAASPTERPEADSSPQRGDLGAQPAATSDPAEPASSGAAATANGPSEPQPQPEADASEVQGLAGTHLSRPAAAGPLGSSVTQGVSQFAATRSTAGVAALGSAAAPSATRGQTGQPAQAVQSAAATTASKSAAKAAAPRPSVPPEDARALLNEVRIQILDGKREARIQLRPVELGRLDLLIRVDGNQVVAKVAAETKEALAVLEAHAPELRSWLAKDGAESVDLQFSLIEPGEEGFAHQGEEGEGAAFESEAERRSFASPGTRSRPMPDESRQGDDDPQSSIPRPGTSGGVDFVA